MIKQISFGGRIRKIRAKNQLNVQDFATKIGVSKGTVSLWENDKVVPPRTTISLIGKLFGINENWLLTGTGEMEPGGGRAETFYKVPSEEIKIAAEETPDLEALVKKKYIPESPAEFTEVNVYSLNVFRYPKDESYKNPIASLLMPSYLAQKGSIAFKMEGQSMEHAAEDGATIGVAFKNLKIQEGKIYIIRLPQGEIAVRRLFLLPDKIVFRADNPIYPSIELDPDILKEKGIILGKISWVMQEI